MGRETPTVVRALTDSPSHVPTIRSASARVVSAVSHAARPSAARPSAARPSTKARPVWVRRRFIGRSDLDLDVDPAGQLQLHEGVDGLGRGREDIDEALVGARLELLAALLVHVRSAEYGEDLLVGRKRDGPADDGAGGLHRADDLLGALVDQRVVVRLELDPNLLAGHAWLSW